MPKKKPDRLKVRPCDQAWLKEKCIWERLFPDVYGDVVFALLDHMPVLRQPYMRASLEKKAKFLTSYVLFLSFDSDWDIKVENWGEEYEEEVEMVISFLDAPFDPDMSTEAFHESRRFENYSAINEVIKGHIASLRTSLERRMRLLPPPSK